MITKDNLTQVLNEITQEQVKKAYDTYEDHILLEVTCSNACHWVNFECLAYSEETEQEANDNGQLFCDWDTFLQLFKESDSINPFLIELL